VLELFGVASQATRSGAVFTAAIITAVVSFGLAALTTETDVNRPDSEEEFESVLTEAVRRGSRGRVVFLVDELDRASPDEVLATLRTVRSFLGIQDTAFVVAADRDVIETALSHQPTHVFPSSPENTYSGFSGAYLDKLFQVQLHMPPVRGRRLTHMAIRLVDEKVTQSEDCIWRSVANVEEVVSVLLPTHVRSPRRVKVLLNSYATALRVAQLRWDLQKRDAIDFEDPDRQVALAKLVCLRTEFPLFSRQLPEHPRLVAALTAYLESEEDEDVLADYPEGVRQLVLEYATLSLPVDGPSHPSPSAESQPIVESADEPEAPKHRLPALERRRADELLRYVSKTANAPHPGRDLIYGTSLGDVFDLDPDVAAELESSALDAREGEAGSVVGRLGTREQPGAVRLLADLVSTEVGIDRRNAMTALMAVVNRADISADLSVASSALTDALRTYRRTEDFEDEWTETLLSLSKWVTTGDRPELQTSLLRRPSWQENGERVAKVLGTADWWDAEALDEMRASIPHLLEAHADVVPESVLNQRAPVAASMWSVDAWKALGEANVEAEIVSEIADLLANGDRSIAWAGVSALLDEGYEEFALTVASSLHGPQSSDEMADILRAWTDGSISPSRWGLWADVLETRIGDSSRLAELTAQVVHTMAVTIRSGSMDSAVAGNLALSLHNVGLELSADPAFLDDLVSGWWRDEGISRTQGELVEWLTGLKTVWPGTDAASDRYRSKSIVAALSSAEPLAVAAEDLILKELDLEGPPISPEQRAAVRPNLSVLGPGRQELAFARIWRLDRLEGQMVPFDVLEPTIAGTSDAHNQALAIWIAIGLPPYRELWDVLLRVGPSRWLPPITDAVSAYLDSVGRTGATWLVVRMLRETRMNTVPLLQVVAPSAVNQTKAAAEVADLLEKATNKEERRRVLLRIEALGLTSRNAQTVIVEALDQTRQKSMASAADILAHFPGSLADAPKGHTLLNNLKAQAKKADRSDLERLVNRIRERLRR
jgi:hypothetical protein